MEWKSRKLFNMLCKKPSEFKVVYMYSSHLKYKFKVQSRVFEG